MFASRSSLTPPAALPSLPPPFLQVIAADIHLHRYCANRSFQIVVAVLHTTTKLSIVPAIWILIIAQEEPALHTHKLASGCSFQEMFQHTRIILEISESSLALKRTVRPASPRALPRPPAVFGILVRPLVILGLLFQTQNHGPCRKMNQNL